MALAKQRAIGSPLLLIKCHPSVLWGLMARGHPLHPVGTAAASLKHSFPAALSCFKFMSPRLLNRCPYLGTFVHGWLMVAVSGRAVPCVEVFLAHYSPLDWQPPHPVFTRDQAVPELQCVKLCGGVGVFVRANRSAAR